MSAPYVTDWHDQLALTRCLPDGVTTGARLIYTLIVGHMRETCTSYPGYATLAKESGLTPDTVWRRVRELRLKRLLDVTPGVGKDTNIYGLIDFRVIHSLRADAEGGVRADAEGVSAPARSGIRADAVGVSAPARVKKY